MGSMLSWLKRLYHPLCPDQPLNKGVSSLPTKPSAPLSSHSACFLSCFLLPCLHVWPGFYPPARPYPRSNLVNNPINRYSVSDRTALQPPFTPLIYNADGSLTVYISVKRPDPSNAVSSGLGLCASSSLPRNTPNT